MKIFCFTVPKTFATESLYVVFHKTSGIEKGCGLERVGVSRFSVEKFLSYRSKKFCRGNLQCVTNFSYGNFFASEVVTIFCRKFFRLIVPKKSVEEQFCAVFQRISDDQRDYG